GDEWTFIALEETSHPVRLVANVGDRTPAFASPSGQVILAARAPQVVAAEYAGRSLVTPTGRRLRGVEELLEILEAVRLNGWAENHDGTALAEGEGAGRPGNAAPRTTAASACPARTPMAMSSTWSSVPSTATGTPARSRTCSATASRSSGPSGWASATSTMISAPRLTAA